MEGSFVTDLITTAAPYAASIITGLVSWGLYEISKYVRSKTKNELALTALEQISATVETTVKDLQQTLVPAIKQAAADGVISGQDAAHLRATAVSKIKAQLQPKLIKNAEVLISDVDALINALIEKNVLELKPPAAV